MVINKNTKVSVVIKHKLEAIELIASINPHFKKLKNPILRALLAPRVTLFEASKIGKCDLNILFEKLKTIGFTIEESSNKIIEEESECSKNTEFTVVKTIDVRPIIESSSDPFLLIMNAIKELNVGETLEVINYFEPIPLIRILTKKGLNCKTICKNEDLYYSYFEKKEIINENNSNNVNLIAELSEEDFAEAEKKLEGQLIEINVRDLEMPLPMLTILEELEQLKEGYTLKVLHKKVPQFLIPELEKRVFTTRYFIKSDNEVLILISK